MAAFYLVNDDEKAERKSMKHCPHTDEESDEADMNICYLCDILWHCHQNTRRTDERDALRLEFAKAAAAKPDVFKESDSPGISWRTKFRKQLTMG